MPSPEELSMRFGLELLDSLPHAVFALDATRRPLVMNQRAERLVERGDALVGLDGGVLGEGVFVEVAGRDRHFRVTVPVIPDGRLI